MQMIADKVINRCVGLRSIGSLALAALVGAAITAHAADWSGYERHFNVSFPGYTGGTALTNFPVLVRLSSSLNDFNYAKCKAANGGDLRFSDDDGNLTTGSWGYPWNDGPIEVHNRSVDAFRRLCREARRYAEETGVKRVCLGPLNEWGEGSYAEPNGEFGFGMYEAVRDVFGVKPEDGWPFNYTPADIGRGPYPVEDDDGGPVKTFNGYRWR